MGGMKTNLMRVSLADRMAIAALVDKVLGECQSIDPDDLRVAMLHVKALNQMGGKFVYRAESWHKFYSRLFALVAVDMPPIGSDYRAIRSRLNALKHGRYAEQSTLDAAQGVKDPAPRRRRRRRVVPSLLGISVHIPRNCPPEESP
jgi:hypothetical protein